MSVDSSLPAELWRHAQTGYSFTGLIFQKNPEKLNVLTDVHSLAVFAPAHSPGGLEDVCVCA